MSKNNLKVIWMIKLPYVMCILSYLLKVQFFLKLRSVTTLNIVWYKLGV